MPFYDIIEDGGRRVKETVIFSFFANIPETVADFFDLLLPLCCIPE